MKRIFLNALSTFKLAYNATHFRIKSFFNISTKKPVRIDDYGGFASSNYLYLKGRVLADRFITNTNQDSLWRIFMNNYRRFGSREIQSALVEIEFGQNIFEVHTDVEGYFEVDSLLSFPIEGSQRQWQRAFCRVKKTPWQEVDVHRLTEVLVLSAQTKRAVISDIDDTILKTELKSLFKLQAIYLTFLKSAAGRKSFQRGAAFYRNLQNSFNEPGDDTPFFYVSKSPWNLYDVLKDFLKLNKLPEGPLLLRDIGLPHEKRAKGYHGHKKKQILKILERFPEVQFLCIGDTGEADPTIYFNLAKKFPDRILGIYLRDVGNTKKRRKLERRLKKEKLELPICIFKNYREAEEHAIRNKFIK